MTPQAPSVLEAQLVRFAPMLVVRDPDASAAFYESRFGFELIESVDGLRLLRLGSVHLYLIPQSPPSPDKPHVTLAPMSSAARPPVNLVFRVRDVRATHRELEARGVRFLAPPRQPAWGGWRCFAQDPDGYLIELEEP
jgi:catechol 2,3-dioxygenase-like lactoylglutathione lyase family enzyme